MALITKIMNIDIITVSGSMTRSINQGRNEDKDCLAWINDEYPGVSEIEDFD